MDILFLNYKLIIILNLSVIKKYEKKKSDKKEKQILVKAFPRIT